MKNNWRITFGKESLLSILLFFSVFIFSCGQNHNASMVLVDKNATKETVKLYENIKMLSSKGIMIGHHDDLAYGIGWSGEAEQSDIKKICNDYPAVYGWDVSRIETDSPYNIDSVPFEKIKEYVRITNAKGGINTFSWHLNNPLTGGNAWDITSDETVKNILPGGKINPLFTWWLDKLAAFFSDLKDDEGKPIPVIFRPYHENTGSWFWWGKKLCIAEDYKNLWQFTVTYLRDVKNIHNLLYAYSPSDDAFDSKKEFAERYPGDGFVDIIGFDSYQFNNDGQSFSAKLNKHIKMLDEIAAEKGKIAALTETGYEKIPDPQWWTNVLWKAIENSNISYVLFWRNAYDRPNHFFVPYPGQCSEKNFVEFYNLPKTLFQKDITSELSKKQDIN